MIMSSSIFDRFFSGTSTAEDHDTLGSIFENGDDRLFDEYCRDKWGSECAEMTDADRARMKTEVMNRIAAQEKEVAKKVFIRRFCRVAAAAAIAAVVIIGSLYILRPSQPEVFEVIADRGQKSTLTLPDGSRVWINSASSVSYTADYNVKDRNVYLKGEAFFEVASCKDLPFVVHAQNLKVTALGTKFNVRAYSEDQSILTTLVEGKVSATASDNSQILMPNQEAVYDKVSGQIIKADVQDDAHAVPWMQNGILFQDNSLEEIAVILERMYNVNIVFEDEQVKKYSYTGLIRNNSLSNILDLISGTSPVNYTMTTDTIKFYMD